MGWMVWGLLGLGYKQPVVCKEKASVNVLRLVVRDIGGGGGASNSGGKFTERHVVVWIVVMVETSCQGGIILRYDG